MTETLCEKPARPKPWAWMAAGWAAATAIIAGLNGTHPAEALTTARILGVASWTITLTYVSYLAHINDRLGWTAIGTAAATGVATILLEMGMGE